MDIIIKNSFQQQTKTAKKGFILNEYSVLNQKHN